jgi:hypothetical protein
VGETKDAKPWPLWGRVLFWTVFALVVAFLVVDTVRGGSPDWSAARIVVAVVAVPAVALVFVSLVLRGRTQGSMKRLDAQLADLADAVRGEQARPPGERPSGASDGSLTQTLAAVEVARTALQHGDPRDAVTAPELQDVPADWRADSPLGRVMAECAGTTRRLARQLRTLDRQRR